MTLKHSFLAAVAGVAGMAFADIQPASTAAETTAAIQSAIDAAAIAAAPGTVTLAAGTFEINAQLMVTGGVTVVGQGWDHTTIKQTTSGQRVATVGEASKLQGVTVTGGKLTASWNYGSGVYVEDGSVSFCRITGNSSAATGAGGVGVSFKKGSIDHCVIDNNRTASPSTIGGGIGLEKPSGTILVDTCLIYGNSAKKGGGIGVAFDGYHKLMTVRNTTIANNTAGELGGAIFSQQHSPANRYYDLMLVNCLLSDNASGSGDMVAFNSNSGTEAAEAAKVGCSAQSSYNVFDNGFTFGENATSVSGSGAAWFVDAANGDYHLASGADPIGAGATYDGISTDLDGVAFAATPSAGCYEAAGATPPAPHEHSWGVATYSWTKTSDGYTCKATSVCDGNTAHVTNETVTAGYQVVTAPTETTDGEGLYTAVFANALFVGSPTKTVVLPKTGSGSSEQPPAGDELVPGATAAATTQAIQDAIDAAANEATPGTVTLAAGTFEINAQLMVTGGVTVVGQGWKQTTLKQTTSGERVATVNSGAKIQGVTVTGGKLTVNGSRGAGVFVEGGAVSSCRVTGNTGTANNIYGAGIFIAKGTIDHCVIDNNSTSLAGGGAIGFNEPKAVDPIVVDTCLIYGNSAKKGGAIYAEFNGWHQLLTVRNTTMVNNTASETGGAIFEQQHNNNKNYDLMLINCVLADNVSGSGDALAFNSYAGAAAIEAAMAGCAAQSTGNVFDNGFTFGENATSVAGSGKTWFVDAANGDYHLASGASPIGAGVWYEGIVDDLDGVERSDTPAAGCYEFGGPVIAKKGVIYSIW